MTGFYVVGVYLKNGFGITDRFFSQKEDFFMKITFGFYGFVFYNYSAFQITFSLIFEDAIYCDRSYIVLSFENIGYFQILLFVFFDEEGGVDGGFGVVA